MSKRKFQYWSFQFLIILTIILVASKISFLFEPVGIFFTTLFFPIIISGFLFFILNPFVHLIQRGKVPKVIAILILFAVVIGLFVLVIGNIVPTISKQLAALMNDLPGYVKKTEAFFNSFSQSEGYRWFMTQDYVSQKEIMAYIVDYANTLPERITSGLSGFLGVVTNIAITIITVPFLLFFMLKDGEKFPAALGKFIPKSYRAEAINTLKDTGNTLSSYIQGQITVALFVGTLSFIGFFIIDLPYAIVMALIIAVTNIIPYVGPIIGGAPAVIVALFESPTMAFLTLLVILIAQQLEGNLISPLILGKTLNTHPATIILLLLVAGNLAGILGMLLAVPTYAVVKTIVLNSMNFLKARKMAKEVEQENPNPL
ncbi:AI-2E family transporter [Cytobacillus purgationiresistens]|uniref:PurR-regulated permease PerM n=1 Tax=Cytobacillus purgationiresistens TaxID=863449 RepID=A0ABU0ADU6_9BACI|nr:AI-2E family transporter [Cytobacillus purgationiresistens]MDQ0269059.1 putative PurR-regulated permease PerM [Cytobacillus purgationiresistens]